MSYCSTPHPFSCSLTESDPTPPRKVHQGCPGRGPQHQVEEEAHLDAPARRAVGTALEAAQREGGLLHHPGEVGGKTSEARREQGTLSSAEDVGRDGACAQEECAGVASGVGTAVL